MKPGDTKKLVYNSENSNVTYVGSRTSILGREENISIKDEHRVKHCLTTGETGTGKSFELLHVALQDTVKGHGIAIFNPKGVLIDRYLARIPENRVNDLIYINPAEHPITGINVLEPYVSREASVAAKTNEIELTVSNLIQLFKHRSDNWGDRFGRVFATLLRAGIEANIEYRTGYTLLDIKHCVTDNSQLEDLIDDTNDPELRSQLVEIKDNLSNSQLEPLVRRLNDFTENKTVRHVISSEKSDIDFREVINENKILLLDAREGQVGKTVTQLLTSIVITKLWAAAQHRYYQDPDVLEPFYLFIDEIQSFPSEGEHFEEILSKAREYRLGCWLVTQYLSQLPRKMQDAATNNCRTKLVFNPTGSNDLSKLNRMLHGIDQKQINGLGDFRAILQTPQTHQRKQATIIDTFPPWYPSDIDLDRLKTAASPATETRSTPQLVVGKGNNAGGEKHGQLLQEAANILRERGLQVKTLYQNKGDDKPDGHVYTSDNSVAHLEVEHGTLSKPAKALKNLHRATEYDRECIFIVEEGNAEKLENILSDPVNRNGNQHRDENGEFSYYKEDGEPITELDWIKDADYRIMELSENSLQLYKKGENATRQNPLEELRDIDRTVLNCIKNGEDDVQKITSTTGLPNHKVNYSFKKLEENGLIQVTKPEEPVERVINGQKRVFQVKTAELTEGQV